MEEIGLANSNKIFSQEISPAKCLAKNITLFLLSVIVIYELLKDL